MKTIERDDEIRIPIAYTGHIVALSSLAVFGVFLLGYYRGYKRGFFNGVNKQNIYSVKKSESRE